MPVVAFIDVGPGNCGVVAFRNVFDCMDPDENNKRIKENNAKASLFIYCNSSPSRSILRGGETEASLEKRDWP